MKLLIAADIFPPESGGPATYAVTLANALPKHGIEVTVVSLNPESDMRRVYCPVFAVSYRNKLCRYVEYFRLLLRHAKHADMVYAMGPVNAGLPALFAARLRRKKFAVKVVGDYAWEQGVQRWQITEDIDAFQNTKHPGMVGVLQRIQSNVTRRADAVIVPCNYLREMVTGWGASRAHIYMVYNAVSLRNVAPSAKPRDEQWLVSVGRLVPWKGMEMLIRIMIALREKFPALRLKIIGGGPERGRLQRLIKELRLEEAVEIMGEISREKVLSYIAAADAVVLNSGYEGLSHVLLETLALGVPIVASRKGGNPEIIIPGKTGELFEYNAAEECMEKIVRVLEGRRALQVFSGVNERESFFAQFQLATMVRRTKELFEKICD